MFSVLYLENAHGVCFISSEHMLQSKSEDRAVLGSVKWIQEDRVSVILCAWVVEPSPIPETGFLLKDDVTVEED